MGQVAFVLFWKPLRSRCLRAKNRMRVERNLLKHFKLIWVVQSSPAKHSAFHPTQISGYCRHPVPTRGAFRDRHERGMGCDGRSGIDRRTMQVADGEVVWS